MRWVYLALVVTLSACSTVKTTKNVSAYVDFKSSEPFSVLVSAPTPQLEKLIREYIITEFGRTLKITEGANSQGFIEVTYASSGQGNGFADWQNSTMLLIIRTLKNERLWTGEYNYKGGMEMSGWSVTTREEAAKLVVQRVSEQFESDLLR